MYSTELAEVLHTVQVAGLHVLHQVPLGICPGTLRALPPTVHFHNVGADQIGQGCNQESRKYYKALRGTQVHRYACCIPLYLQNMENVGQKQEGRPIRMLCSAALDFWRELSDLNPRHFIIKIFHVFQISTHENEFPH